MPQIQVAEKLLPILTTPKRVKIAVGGRGGQKSTAFADCWVKFCSDGERLCCGREFMNLIEESVHPLISARIEAMGVPGMEIQNSHIYSKAGGEIFYRGLSRNPTGIQSMFGVKRMWIEEGQSLSDKTLDALMPTIRESDSEIWISMNRGSSKDPVSQRFLKAHEKDLARYGYYEDDDLLIVQVNYYDNPWFPDVLEQERQRDFKNMTRAKYDHIWEGAYSDTVEDAIIEPAWFDACVDAHIKLGFEPQGQERVAYDPADSGDAKALAYAHGSVFKDVKSTDSGRIDTATDWATSYANERHVDAFIWDADGMGFGLQRQIADAFEGKKVECIAFHGGAGADNPDSLYAEGDVKAKKNKDTFANKRAQYYVLLRDRMFKTYKAVEAHEAGRSALVSPDELVSFSSEIEELDLLRAEICSVARKYVASGRIQLVSKSDMKEDSPNMADAVMMCGMEVDVYELEELEYPQVSIV